MQLEEMTLYDLKAITKILRTEHNLLRHHKIYNLCKYDLICILRNSGYIDERLPKKLRIASLAQDKNGDLTMDFEYIPKHPFKRSYYKGKHLRKTKTGQSITSPWDGNEFTIRRGEFVVTFK